ncbi:hypothetical protein HK405_009183 [Cladochytrium tenue]|nr:hypothetical protein HK405_009183 [Cladochytrium tenue]
MITPEWVARVAAVHLHEHGASRPCDPEIMHSLAQSASSSQELASFLNDTTGVNLSVFITQTKPGTIEIMTDAAKAARYCPILVIGKNGPGAVGDGSDLTFTKISTSTEVSLYQLVHNVFRPLSK